MERVAESAKQPSPAIAGHGRAASPTAASLPPALELQQLAGNQAMQQLLRSGFLQARLAISNPDDPEEREADNVANTIMRKAAGAPCSCSPGEEMCEECQQKQSQPTISRRASAATAPEHIPRIVSAVLRSPGHPLDAATRAFFEPRFGHDFSHVRVHTDSHAADSARSINAHAYTAGSNIVFAPGQYSPDSSSGRALLAHELTHVTQKGGVSPLASDPNHVSPAHIHRQLDPANPAAWYLIHRGTAASEFLPTLSAAPENALKLEQSLNSAPPPANDDERDQAVGQIETLIRLNALGLMASHRAGVTRKRDELLAPTPSGASGSKSDDKSKKQAAQNANAIRGAANQAVRLKNLKEELEGYERALRMESTTMLRVGGDTLSEALDKILDNTEKYRSERIAAYLGKVAQNLVGRRSLEHGIATALVFNMGRYLADWRHQQASGAAVGLDRIYEAFPFLTQLEPADVPSKGGTDAQLMQSVSKAFDELIEKIDNAIEKIGAGDIHSFDLPEAVRETRDSLSPAMRGVLDKAKQDHEVLQFWANMGLTFLQVLLVFIPVVGPFLAAALGLGQVIAGVDDALNRYEIGQASTSPEGGVLGVEGPSKFEWAMLGVQAALTLVDLKGAWAEIDATRPHFPDAEPRPVEEPKIEGVNPEGELKIAEAKPSEHVVAEKPTASGDHTIQVTEDGEVRFCSDCQTMRKEYFEELADAGNAGLKSELDAADQITDPTAKATAEVAIEKKLAAARSTKQGPLIGKTDYKVFDPSSPGKLITDIDRVEPNALWEQKSATNAIDRLTGVDKTADWIKKHITTKFKNYLEARKVLPGFKNAEIGFEFTTPGVDPAFRAAVEAEIAALRVANPDVKISLIMR